MAKQAFGGTWTTTKLDAVAKYLGAYVSALKSQGFDLYYIDAFAGTGYREDKQSERGDVLSFLKESEVTKISEGSALRALGVRPRFSKYIFIEKMRSKLDELKKNCADAQSDGAQIEFMNEDANGALKSICANFDRTKCRAVVFLDPFGMQVEWATVEAIARTKAMDLWYLFPTFMGINRMLPNMREPSEKWKTALERVLGTDDWASELYRESNEPQTELFRSEDAEVRLSKDRSNIVPFAKSRLEKIFARVADPLELPIKGNPAYHLFFAVGNPSKAAIRLALKIAEHILKNRT